MTSSSRPGASIRWRIPLLFLVGIIALLAKSGQIHRHRRAARVVASVHRRNATAPPRPFARSRPTALPSSVVLFDSGSGTPCPSLPAPPPPTATAGGTTHVQSHTSTSHTDDTTDFTVVAFEISGKVQHVHFRRHAGAKARELGFNGWCRNTPRGTVEGEYEYRASSVSGPSQNKQQAHTAKGKEREKKREAAVAAEREFRDWLCTVGSPAARIEACTFSAEAVSDAPRFRQFRVIRVNSHKSRRKKKKKAQRKTKHD